MGLFSADKEDSGNVSVFHHEIGTVSCLEHFSSLTHLFIFEVMTSALLRLIIYKATIYFLDYLFAFLIYRVTFHSV